MLNRLETTGTHSGQLTYSRTQSRAVCRDARSRRPRPAPTSSTSSTRPFRIKVWSGCSKSLRESGTLPPRSQMSIACFQFGHRSFLPASRQSWHRFRWRPAPAMHSTPLLHGAGLEALENFFAVKSWSEWGGRTTWPLSDHCKSFVVLWTSSLAISKLQSSFWDLLISRQRSRLQLGYRKCLELVWSEIRSKIPRWCWSWTHKSLVLRSEE